MPLDPRVRKLIEMNNPEIGFNRIEETQRNIDRLKEDLDDETIELMEDFINLVIRVDEVTEKARRLERRVDDRK